MRLFGNAIQNYYGTLTITSPASGGIPLIAVAGSTGSAASFQGFDICNIQINSTAATNRSLVALQQAAVTLARIGLDGTQNLLSDSVNGDLCIVSVGQSVRFGTAAGGSTRILLASAGNVSVLAPSSGTTLSLTGLGGGVNTLSLAAPLGTSPGTVDSGQILSLNNSSTAGGDQRLLTFGQLGANAFIRPVLSGSGPSGAGLVIVTGTGATTFGSTGNVSINAPASGTTLTVTSGADLSGILINGAQNNISLTLNNTQAGGTTNWRVTSSATGSGFGAGNLVIGPASSNFLQVASTGGVTISAPSSGAGLTVAGAGGGTQALAVNSGTGQLNSIFDSTNAAGGYIAYSRSAVIKGYIGDSSSLASGTLDDFCFRAQNGLDLATNAGIGRVHIATAGNVTINAPASGTALTVTSAGTTTAAAVLNTASSTFSATANAALILNNTGTQTPLDFQFSGVLAGRIRADSSNNLNIVSTGSGSIGLWTGGDSGVGATRVTVASAGNVTISTPTSGVTLTVNNNGSGSFGAAFGDGTVDNRVRFRTSSLYSVAVSGGASGGNFYLGPSDTTATPGLSFANNAGTQLALIDNSGNLSVANGTGAVVGPVYAGIPQNSQSAAYTLVLADANKHIYHPSADTTARTWTIPANASVAYPIGTAITFDNDTSAGVITLAITTDTLVWLPSGTTGSRSIAANGQGTALKVTATRWHLTGTGIT